MKKDIEADIENHLVALCKKHHFVCFKFISSSMAGVPDRIVIGKHATTNEGITIFLELKNPQVGGKSDQHAGAKQLRNKQLAVIKTMIDAGAQVYVAHTKESVERVLSHVYGITL